MKFLWISGWAVPPTWLAEQAQAFFPASTHLAVSPTEAAEAIKQKNLDALGGYSLGALWLLKNQNEINESISVILLAPIFSFMAENGDGGRIALAQLRLQRRRFRQDAKVAVTDFYRRSGLANELPEVGEFAAEQIAALNTELGWLEDWRATEPPPKSWRGYVGQADPLLDAEKLREQWPDLQLVPNAGHAPGPLLRAAAENFPPKALR